MMKKIMSLLDLAGQTVDSCAREILKFTPQLYTKNPSETDNIIPIPTASGVLLEINNNYFLITAGHVIEDHNPEDIGLLIGNVFYILNGILKYVRPSHDVQSDKIDIAIWKIDDNVVQDLKKGYSFLPFDKIDFNHSIDTEPKYLIVGFPWKKTKERRKERKIIPIPLVFLTKESKSSFYTRLNYEKHSNLLLDYRQMKVKSLNTGMVQRNASPQGVSGCGVWHIPKLISLDGRLPDFKLVGQIIEQNDEKTILISTRIHMVTEVLRRDFGLNIPQSNTTRLI